MAVFLAGSLQAGQQVVVTGTPIGLQRLHSLPNPSYGVAPAAPSKPASQVAWEADSTWQAVKAQEDRLHALLASETGELEALRRLDTLSDAQVGRRAYLRALERLQESRLKVLEGQRATIQADIARRYASYR